MMTSKKDFKERRTTGATIMYYYGMFVIFILIPLLLGYAIFIE